MQEDVGESEDPTDYTNQAATAQCKGPDGQSRS